MYLKGGGTFLRRKCGVQVFLLKAKILKSTEFTSGDLSEIPGFPKNGFRRLRRNPFFGMVREAGLEPARP